MLRVGDALKGLAKADLVIAHLGEGLVIIQLVALGGAVKHGILPGPCVHVG